MDDCKKVGKFLQTLTDVEYRYLHHIIDLVDNMKDLIEAHQLSKETFCQMMKIDESVYDDYISGNYEYTIMDASKLNVVWKTLKASLIKKPVKFGDDIKE